MLILQAIWNWLILLQFRYISSNSAPNNKVIILPLVVLETLATRDYQRLLSLTDLYFPQVVVLNVGLVQ